MKCLATHSKDFKPAILRFLKQTTLCISVAGKRSSTQMKVVAHFLALYYSSWHSFIAPPAMVSLLLLPASDYDFFTAPPSQSPLLLILVKALNCSSQVILTAKSFDGTLIS